MICQHMIVSSRGQTGIETWGIVSKTSTAED